MLIHFMKTDKNSTENRRSAPGKPRLDLLKRIDKPQGFDISELVSSCLEQNNFTAAAIHLVNTLAFNLQCDRVSVGMVSGSHIQLSALSNSAKFDRKTNLIRYIEAAMDESIDESSIIVVPSQHKTELTIRVAHEQLAKFQNKRAICTIPLRHRGHYIGALCLERSAEQEFDTSIIQRAENIAKHVGPLLHVMHQEQRGFLKRISDSFRNFFVDKFGPDKAVSTAAGISLVTALLLLSLYPTSYRVTANAVMEGSIQRIVAAPVDGYIATANKRAGDLVNKGELIATLDDRELKLESVKLESQLLQLQREYRESLAISDRSKVSVLNARIKQIDAKRELVSEQLSRLQLVAPIEGIIIDGDLSQSLGSPVERGDALYKVAPVDDYRIILNVDESEISHIEKGQTGLLVLSALPDKNLRVTVSKITPVSTSLDGRTFFRVEARLNEKISQLQPGMEGIGKIDVGDRKLIWTLTHNLVDRFRLLLWHIWL